MVLLRRKLMGITFDVGRVTLLALYQESIKKCILFVIRFNDYFDYFLELSIQQIAILCPFSADRSSELIRRRKFSDIWSIAVPYKFRVELYTCTF